MVELQHDVVVVVGTREATEETILNVRNIFDGEEEEANEDDDDVVADVTDKKL